jgi:hypothetical protein
MFAPARIKPAYGARLDPYASLRVGLQGAYLLDEGGGNYAYDATNNLALKSTGFGSTNPWGSASTGGLSCTVNGGGFVAATPAALQVAFPVSFAVAFRQLGAPVSSSFYFGSLYNATSGNPFYAWALTWVTDLHIQFNNAGSANTLNSSFAPATGVDTVASGTLGTSGIWLYAQGAQVATTTGVTAPTYGATPQISIGLETGTGGRNCNSLIYWCLWWNRVLAASEHAFLGSSIYSVASLFAPAWRPGAPPAAAAGNIIRVNWDGGFKQLLEGGFA